MLVYPHQQFYADFKVMLIEAQSQERKDPLNLGEYDIMVTMYNYFKYIVFPTIRINVEVYDATQQFAEVYGIQCFKRWRQLSNIVPNVRLELRILDKRANSVIDYHRKRDAIIEDKLDAIRQRGRNIAEVFNLEKLELEEVDEVLRLRDELIAQEEKQLYVTADVIRQIYAKILPRIVYVIQRVIHSETTSPQNTSGNSLVDMSRLIDWYQEYLDEEHPLFPILGNLGDFYRVIRNSESHPEDYKVDNERDRIIFFDKRMSLIVQSHQLMQRYRHLVYFCELGMRGISAVFAEIERGEKSNALFEEYNKIFEQGVEVTLY